MFGLRKKEKKAKPLGISLNVTINLVGINIKTGLFEPPNTHRIFSHWESTNSSTLNVRATWLRIANGEWVFVVNNESYISSDTPVVLLAADSYSPELVLSLDNGYLAFLCNGFLIASTPLDYWKNLLAGEALVEFYDPMQNERGTTHTDQEFCSYQGYDVSVRSLITVRPNSVSLINSMIRLDCASVFNEADLLRESERGHRYFDLFNHC